MGADAPIKPISKIQRRSLSFSVFVERLPAASVAVAVISAVTFVRVRALRSARFRRLRRLLEIVKRRVTLAPLATCTVAPFRLTFFGLPVRVVAGRVTVPFSATRQASSGHDRAIAIPACFTSGRCVALPVSANEMLVSDGGGGGGGGGGG